MVLCGLDTGKTLSQMIMCCMPAYTARGQTHGQYATTDEFHNHVPTKRNPHQTPFQPPFGSVRDDGQANPRLLLVPVRHVPHR